MDDKETLGIVPNSSCNLDKISEYAKIIEIVDNDITTVFVDAENWMEYKSHKFNNAKSLAKHLQKSAINRVNIFTNCFYKEDESFSSLLNTLEKHKIHIENVTTPDKEKPYHYCCCGINEQYLFIIMVDGKYYCNNLEYNDLESFMSYLETNLGKIKSISIYCRWSKGKDMPNIFNYLSEKNILVKEFFPPPLNDSRDLHEFDVRLPYSILKIQRINNTGL